MIAIRNISPKVEPTGKHEYEVRINREVITTFWHNREDGLTICLQKASEAVYDELIIKPAIRYPFKEAKKKYQDKNGGCKKRVKKD